MRSTVKLLSIALLVLLVSVPAWAQNGKCEVVLGTIAAEFVPEGQGGSWIGQGYLAFGKNEPIATTLVDKGTSGGPNKAGGLSGEETLTFTVPGTNDTLVIPVRFWGSAKQVPYMNEYIASGIISGTERYDGVTGNVTIHGQYIFGPGKAWPWVWMAEIHGVICGRK